MEREASSNLITLPVSDMGMCLCQVERWRGTSVILGAPPPHPSQLPREAPGLRGAGRGIARCKNEWDHATAALGELMRQKKKKKHLKKR